MGHHDSSESTALQAKITALAEQVAASMGMEVVLVELRGSGGRSVLRIYIDRPGGVNLEDCERFSKRVSVLLDVEDPVPHSYVLEVSSPGLDRPLVREEDFRRFLGKRAKVRTRVATEGRRNYQGRILDAGNGRVILETETGRAIELAVPDIEKANLVIEI
ncbi:MAG: ribosome maturation factor RimP [Acidobacteria bacterium]|nr:ribosome maturation factor RimP [Acidobacteriota bacterium]